MCCFAFIAGLQTTTYHRLASPAALCSVPLLASTAPPTSAVSSLVSTWSSGALAAYHPPPISIFCRLALIQASLILLPALEPVPHKLVQRIQVGQFVEMRDLLGDNIALLQQLDSVQGPFQSFTGGAKPRLQTFTSLSSWLHRFLAYTAIRTTDQATRNQLTYAWLLIQESLRHGSNGWFDYDCALAAGGYQVSTLLFPGILSTLPTRQPSLVRGQGQGHSAFSALGWITIRVSVPKPSGAGPVRPPQSRPARRPDSLQCVLEQRGMCLPRTMHL